MSNMIIYEPSMCCSTGLCGVGVDSELLRISTVINTLKKSGIEVTRFNLTSSPQEFIKNNEVNDFINKNDIDSLPITVLDDAIIITGRYPTNEEFIKLLKISKRVLGGIPKTFKVKEPLKKEKTLPKSDNCCCSDNDCCN